jgi:DNA-binding NarL/FixJ family response regulator
MIRVIIIDDQLIIGAGLRYMFHPSRDGIEIIELFRNVQNTISKADSAQFDFIILDLWIGMSSPQENIKKLRNQFPGKSILIFTHEESLEWKRKMIQEGVNGYLTKSATKTELRKVIHGIIQNGYYFLPTILNNQFLEGLNIPDPIEYSVVILLSEGCPLKSIASKHSLSIPTIERILMKLRNDYSAHNNCELVTAFLKRNFQS